MPKIYSYPQRQAYVSDLERIKVQQKIKDRQQRINVQQKYIEEQRKKKYTSKTKNIEIMLFLIKIILYLKKKTIISLSK